MSDNKNIFSRFRNFFVNRNDDVSLEDEKIHFDKLPSSFKNHYKFEKVLGKGGYGVVLQIRDKLIGRLVALKILYKKKRTDIAFDRFMQEARIAGCLDHENIVIIHTVEKYKSVACIVMEYLGEDTLAQVIKEKAPLKEYEALLITQGILSGLVAAHNLGAIHHDIKPENILFDSKGRPKISDFGIAYLPRESGGIGKVDYNLRGTPIYMAPENFFEQNKVDHRCDLYSVGVILYEMITNSKPYNLAKISSAQSFVDIYENTKIKPITDINENVSTEVVDFANKLLSNVSQRYFSAQEALYDLKKIISKLKIIDEDNLYNTSRINLFEDVLRLLLVDGNMTPAKRRELVKRQKRLSITDEEAQILENKVINELKITNVP